jgi:hypothetical protein
MIERRTTPRRRILKSGTIEFVGGSIICAIKNISDLGASLQI